MPFSDRFLRALGVATIATLLMALELILLPEGWERSAVVVGTWGLVVSGAAIIRHRRSQ